MIRHRSIRPTSASTAFIALFGNSLDIFGPPVGATPDCWTEQTLSIPKMTMHAVTAPGTNRSYTYEYFVGASQVGTDCVISGLSTDVTVEPGVEIEPSATAGVEASHATKISPVNSPASSASLNITHLYGDLDDAAVSLYAWGTGSTNMVYPGSPTFIGFDGESFNASEAVRQAIIPSAGTFFHFFARYVTVAGTTYNVDFRVNGVTIQSVAIPAHGGSGAFVTADVNVPVVPGDLVSFRINRTAGSGTVFVMYAQILWRES